MKKKSANIGVYFVFVMIMGVHLILSALTPLFADDFSYAYSFVSGSNSRVTDIASLIQSQLGHYQSMNGRVVSHTLAQLFLMMPKIVFNVVNAFMFALLGVLICFHALGKFRSIKMLDLLIAYVALMCLAPAFGQSYLWLVGACNYLFTFVIVLLFLLPYRVSWGNTNKSNVLVSVPSALAMLVFGVIAGNTNENTGVSLVVVLLIYIAAYIAFNRKVRLWMITGWCGTVGGFVTCFATPGNTVRNGGVPLTFSAGSVAKSVIFFTHSAIENFAPIFVLLAVLLTVILVMKSRKGKLTKEALVNSVRNNFFGYFYAVFFLGSVYAMAIPAQFPDRAWSHPLALLVIVLLIALHKFKTLMDVKLREYKIIKGLSCVVLAAVISLCSLVAVANLRVVNYVHKQRVSIIQEAKANNQNEVELPAIVAKSRFVCYDCYGDISEDPEHWANEGMAKYYGIGVIYKVGEVDI